MKRPQDWTAEERLQALIETAGLSEEGLGSWCGDSHGLHTHHLAQWHRELTGVDAGTKSSWQALRALREENRALKKVLRRQEKALAETAALLVLKKKRSRSGGAQGRFIPADERRQALALIIEAMQAGARKQPAGAVLGLSLRTAQRWEREGLADRRKGSRARPANALTETERERVLARLNSVEYAGESPNQVVSKLADRGEYLASEASMYRILRAEKLLAHRHKSAAARRHEATPLAATGPNQVWSWDITWLAGPVPAWFFYLYLILDLYSRKIVAWQVHERECAEYAAALATEACFLEGITRDAVLVLHADNGGAMKGASMLATLQWLGVVPSFSRPRISDDNPFPEALFRTLKYRPEYPEQAFADIAEARAWVEQFVRWYNHDHQHRGIRFVTPQQGHSGQELEILQRRHAVYQAAQRRHPERWSGATRNWSPVRAVELISYRPKTEQLKHQELTKAA